MTKWTIGRIAMNSHFVVEFLSWDFKDNVAYWTPVACYSSINEAINYCKDKDHDYYNIKQFNGSFLVQEYSPDGCVQI